MYEAIVIGGGVVGASLGYHLVRQGVKTLLLDHHHRGRATDAGAGILAPEVSGNRSPAWFNFAVEAVAYYPGLIEHLRADQGGETSYAQCGKLTVAVAAEELEDFSRTEHLIFDRQQQRGIPAPTDLGLITADEARRLFPPLATVQRAIYYRSAARVDGRLLTAALLQAAQNRGLIVKQAEVERLALDGYLAEGVIVAGELLKAGQVVIAGGAWSSRFAEQLLIHLPVEPQRGQIVHLHLPGVETGDWPMISSRRGYYLVCWPGGHIVVGATRETGSGFKPQPTVAGIHEVLSEALWVAPGLAGAEIKEIRVGLRPLTPDWLPVLDRAPGVNNVYLATGHGATGLQLGPYSGKDIADLMVGNGVETDISAFEIQRFYS
jgi:D-amino-acid dehydrogenase